MAKKKNAETGGLFNEPEDFNLSKVIREGLELDRTASAKAIMDYVVAQHPNATINKNSFTVAYYNGKKKLGITSKRGGGTSSEGGKASNPTVKTKRTDLAGGKTAGNGMVQIDAIKTAFDLIQQAGGQAHAIELIKALGGTKGNG